VMLMLQLYLTFSLPIFDGVIFFRPAYTCVIARGDDNEVTIDNISLAVYCV